MEKDEAYQRLIEGNARYAAGKPRQAAVTAALRNDLYTNGQFPYAAIVACSDSRVPVELIFDAGPGELFVIRTAGNIVGLFEMGSLEFAVGQLKTLLVVVLGHDKCGAVRAAVDGGDFSPAIEAIMKEIRSGIKSVACGDSYEIYEDENIQYTLSKIAANPCISKASSDNLVRLVAAKYSLETGTVTFFN